MRTQAHRIAAGFQYRHEAGARMARTQAGERGGDGGGMVGEVVVDMDAIVLHQQLKASFWATELCEQRQGLRRIEAGRALLAAHPQLELILTDDGLQHYALQRDVEITVFPAADMGRCNLRVLPDGGLRAPMPGKIVAVPAKAGDVVSKGQPIVVLEAMKMEHALTAPFDGVVAEFNVAVGDQVVDGAVLAVVKAGEQ